jgi:hypothetical protein
MAPQEPRQNLHAGTAIHRLGDPGILLPDSPLKLIEGVWRAAEDG